VDETPEKPTPPAGTNGFAVAAALFGALGACFLGIPLGLVALVQTRRTGQRGRAAALVGVVLSCVWIGLVVLVATAGIGSDVQRGEGGSVSRGGIVPLPQLRVGDCVDDLGRRTEIAAVPLVRCSQPHQAEVYAIVALPMSDYPGQDALDDLSGDRCEAEYAALDGVSPEVRDDPGVWLTSIEPSQANWLRGDRRVTCLVGADVERSGSIGNAPA